MVTRTDMRGRSEYRYLDSSCARGRGEADAREVGSSQEDNSRHLVKKLS